MVVLPRLLGTLPYALFPLDALARGCVMDVWVPHSSTATKRLGSTDPTRSPKAALSRSSRSEATRDFFWRPPFRQTSDGPPDRGRRDRGAAVGFLERLAVLIEREVVVLPKMRRKPPLDRHALHGGPAGDRLRLDVAGRSAPLGQLTALCAPYLTAAPWPRFRQPCR